MINISYIGAIGVVACIIVLGALWVRMCYQVTKVTKEENKERNDRKND